MSTCGGEVGLMGRAQGAPRMDTGTGAPTVSALLLRMWEHHLNKAEQEKEEISTNSLLHCSS